MKRRRFLLTIPALWAARTEFARAQAKRALVGVISAGRDHPFNAPLDEGFRLGLREAGWTEGRNVAIEFRYAEGKPDRLQPLVEELLRLKVDVLFARGPSAIAAAKQATNATPIVGVDLEGDPVALGYAASLARPGGNVTGVWLDAPSLVGKQLALLREVVPRLSRVGIVGDPSINSAQFRAAADAARILGIELKAFEIRTAEDFSVVFEGAARSAVQALILFTSPLTLAGAKTAGELAAKHRLPVISGFLEFARAGVLMAYAPNLAEIFRRCGTQVGRILKGDKPATLPIERPHKFELIVNAKTARALGLKLSEPFLYQATEVIE